MADALAFHVLTKSVLKEPTKRVLKKFEFYEILGNAAEILLPRTELAAMLAQTVSGFTGGLAGTGDITTVTAASDPGWMIASRTLPPRGRFITRSAFQYAVSTALGHFGASILTGASGLVTDDFDELRDGADASVAPDAKLVGRKVAYLVLGGGFVFLEELREEESRAFFGAEHRSPRASVLSVCSATSCSI